MLVWVEIRAILVTFEYIHFKWGLCFLSEWYMKCNRVLASAFERVTVTRNGYQKQSPITVAWGRTYG